MPDSAEGKLLVGLQDARDRYLAGAIPLRFGPPLEPDEMREEYDFSKGERGKYVGRAGDGGDTSESCGRGDGDISRPKD